MMAGWWVAHLGKNGEAGAERSVAVPPMRELEELDWAAMQEMLDPWPEMRELVAAMQEMTVSIVRSLSGMKWNGPPNIKRGCLD